MIAIAKLHVRAGDFALRDVSFTVPTGGYAAFLGKTGAGKSTVLEALCGLRAVQSGTISLMGRDVTGLKPAARDIGYVPQDLALFPTMTVREHLSFALTLRAWDSEAIGQRVGELAEWLGLAALLDRLPRGLSGGEAQRVALGRALSFRPAVLCLDEPLGSLDDETRAEMHALLRAARERTGVTTLHITHQREDVRQLADQVLVLRDGRVHDETP